MDIKSYAEYLITHMSNAHYASGNKQVNCRCPECGDSIHQKSAHMYISIPWDQTSPSLYYCHKCNSSGIVNYKKFIEWNIFDTNMAIEIENYNNSISKNPRAVKYFNNKVYNIYHRYTSNNDSSEYKSQYICNRLGVDLSYIELANLKIVLNLSDLLNENRIDKFTRDPRILESLDTYFLGFLSVDNAFLNMRRTCNEGILHKSIDKRYVNYSIFDKFDNTKKFYVIPTQIDLSSTHRIPLHIAEGPFDILSIYLNCRNRESGIYSSVTGNNYMNVILYFLLELQLPYLELHIYPDNDRYGSIEWMNNLIHRIPDKTIPVYMHKNTYPGEKDFGVSKNRINESIMKMR